MAKAVKEKVEQTDLTQKLLEQLNGKFGKGTVLIGKSLDKDIKSVPTGSFSLDIATNIGGTPRGKLVEMFGPESSGKSTLAMHLMAEFQKQNLRVMLVDSEHSFDKKYAQAIGVDTDAIIYSQPESMEDAYNIIELVVRSKQVQLIIFDSHTSSIPKKIIEGEVGDATMALQARINSTALGKIHRLLEGNDCTLVGISQLRTNIGGYGDPNVPTGGMAWKFYSDMRLKVSKINDKVNEKNKTTVDVIKNKCGIPFGKAEFSIKWGQGIDRQQEIIDYAVDYGFLKLGAAGWYTVGEDQKIQGDNNLKAFLVDNPEYAKELETKVLAKLKEELHTNITEKIVTDESQY